MHPLPVSCFPSQLTTPPKLLPTPVMAQDCLSNRCLCVSFKKAWGAFQGKGRGREWPFLRDPVYSSWRHCQEYPPPSPTRHLLQGPVVVVKPHWKPALALRQSCWGSSLMGRRSSLSYLAPWLGLFLLFYLQEKRKTNQREAWPPEKSWVRECDISDSRTISPLHIVLSLASPSLSATCSTVHKYGATPIMRTQCNSWSPLVPIDVHSRQVKQWLYALKVHSPRVMKEIVSLIFPALSKFIILSQTLHADCHLVGDRCTGG